MTFTVNASFLFCSSLKGCTVWQVLLLHSIFLHPLRVYWRWVFVIFSFLRCAVYDNLTSRSFRLDVIEIFVSSIVLLRNIYPINNWKPALASPSLLLSSLLLGSPQHIILCLLSLSPTCFWYMANGQGWCHPPQAGENASWIDPFNDPVLRWPHPFYCKESIILNAIQFNSTSNNNKQLC